MLIPQQSVNRDNKGNPSRWWWTPAERWNNGPWNSTAPLGTGGS